MITDSIAFIQALIYSFYLKKKKKKKLSWWGFRRSMFEFGKVGIGVKIKHSTTWQRTCRRKPIYAETRRFGSDKIPTFHLSIF